MVHSFRVTERLIKTYRVVGDSPHVHIHRSTRKRGRRNTLRSWGWGRTLYGDQVGVLEDYLSSPFRLNLSGKKRNFDHVECLLTLGLPFVWQSKGLPIRPHRIGGSERPPRSLLFHWIWTPVSSRWTKRLTSGIRTDSVPDIAWLVSPPRPVHVEGRETTPVGLSDLQLSQCLIDSNIDFEIVDKILSS